MAVRTSSLPAASGSNRLHVDELSSDSDSGENDCKQPEVLGIRGPGANGANAFDPQQNTAQRDKNPWYPYKPGILAIIKPDQDNELKDGFILGKLCEAPALQLGDAPREADVFYVGVHWWSRKDHSERKKKPWYEASFGAQYLDGNKPSIEAIDHGTIGCEVKVTQGGAFVKKGKTREYIDYYRNNWFGLPPDTQ